ncbi:hypothetical protein ACIF80_36185 [Streptomyces sp. NPDC085927]
MITVVITTRLRKDRLGYRTTVRRRSAPLALAPYVRAEGTTL